MTAAKQLDQFIDKYSPEIGALARRVLAKMRKKVPGAVELVYDNYNALAIGFSATEEASDAIFSIALYPRWVTLFFLKGAKLADPAKRLKGSGSVVRHVVLDSAADLDDPEIAALMEQAMTRAEKTIDPKVRRRLIIQSESAKQRPRRPASKK